MTPLSPTAPLDSGFRFLALICTVFHSHYFLKLFTFEWLQSSRWLC